MNKLLVGTILLIGVPLVFLKFRRSLGAALAFLIGVVIISDSLWNWRFETALRAHGQEAVVTPAGDSYTKIIRRSGERIRMPVTFRTAQGEEIIEETELPPGVLEKFQRAERVTVTYLAGTPTRYRFNPWQPTALQNLKFGAFMIVIAAAWMFVRRRSARNAPAKGEMDTVG